MRRRHFFTILLSLLMQIMLIQVAEAQVIVTLPQSEGYQDSTVLIPIYVDLKTYPVISYYFEINYNPDVVEIKEVSVDGTLSAIWPTAPTLNPNFTGKLIVGAYSVGDTIRGSGSLLNLKCVVKGSVGDTTHIRFGNFVLNNGFPAVYKRNAVFTVVDLPSGVGRDQHQSAPLSYSLNANFPDPFRNRTTIGYQMNRSDEVRITIFNSLGQEVVTLAEGLHQPDFYVVHWDGRDRSGNLCRTGLYYCQMRTSQEILTEKMMLVQ